MKFMASWATTRRDLPLAEPVRHLATLSLTCRAPRPKRSGLLPVAASAEPKSSAIATTTGLEFGGLA